MVSKQSICRALSAAVTVSMMAAPSVAWPCSICGCGDPLVVAGDARPVSGNVRLALDAEYLTAAAAVEGDSTSNEAITQYTLRPVVVWSPLESLSLVLQVPLTHKDWSTTGPGITTPLEAHPTGLGDVDLGGRWFLWQQTDIPNRRFQNLALTAGSSLPTGANNIEAQTDGAPKRIDDHAQLGAGSFGPYLGALYAFHQDPWNLSLNVSARGHTTNAFGYRYGLAALWSVRGTYRLVDRLAFTLGLDGRFAQQDTAPDQDGQPPVIQTNTGGLVLEAVPGIAINVVDNVWIHARAQIPFVTRFFGQQSLGPVLSLSVQYSFAG